MQKYALIIRLKVVHDGDDDWEASVGAVRPVADTLPRRGTQALQHTVYF